MMPTFLVPLFTTLILGLFYIYILTIPLNAFVQFMIQCMYQLNGTSAMALGLGIGLLAAADFGGACSKAATAFTLALMAEGILGPNGVFRMCCAIPPLGMGRIRRYCRHYGCRGRKALVCAGYAAGCRHYRPDPLPVEAQTRRRNNTLTASRQEHIPVLQA